jgi:hypothetical protein
MEVSYWHYYSQKPLWLLLCLAWSVMLIWKICVPIHRMSTLDRYIYLKIIHTFAEHRNVDIAMLHPHRRCPGRDSLLTASAGE